MLPLHSGDRCRQKAEPCWWVLINLSQLNSKSTLGVQSIKLPSGVKAAAVPTRTPALIFDQAARGGSTPLRLRLLLQQRAKKGKK